MHIEIDDGYPLQPGRQRFLRGNRNIIEQAESHGALRLGMMPRRAHDGESVLRLAVEQQTPQA